ncbi:MAG: adenylyl-sulfate kinase [Planctomycetota bacterium]
MQYVNRPNLDFRGFCGTLASGAIRPGEEVMILPSRQKSTVKSIESFDGPLNEAFTPMSVTLTLEDEVDASRGDMMVRTGNVPRTSDTFDAMVVWMNEEALVPGRTYLFKHTTQVLPGSIDSLFYKIDVNTLHRSPTPELNLNEIGRVRVALTGPIHYDGYRKNRNTGAFIIIDRITNATVGAGMIQDREIDESRRAVWDEETPGVEGDSQDDSVVSTEEREARFGQQAATVLLTGLTGSGKTTIAGAVERKLFDAGRAVSRIDGEEVRRGLSRDLSFTAEDRSENLRRAAHLAHILNDAGLICVAAFVAPNDAVRQKAAGVIGSNRCLVVHVATPVEVCRTRDTKGQYAAADQGELSDFPGVTAPYEAPENADLVVDPSDTSAEECADAIIDLLRQRGFIR